MYLNTNNNIHIFIFQIFLTTRFWSHSFRNSRICIHQDTLSVVQCAKIQIDQVTTLTGRNISRTVCCTFCLRITGYNYKTSVYRYACITCFENESEFWSIVSLSVTGNFI